MKLRLSASILLLTLATPAVAGTVSKDATPFKDTAPVVAPSKFYVGFFGGEAWSNKFNVSQLGTAYFTEAQSGPLAVDAFGKLGSESSSFFGAQIGYKAQEIFLTTSSPWSVAPAIELEGYGMNSTTFNAAVVNNTDRLDAHDFDVSYPMSRTVFLGNIVLGINHPSFFVHPYVGFGIGSGIIRISGANSTQTNPPETINHYNANPSDTNTAFAGQIKLGVSYDFNQYVSVFADYRWLYLASTQFVFGSTVAADHVATSSWQVNMDAQHYNMVNIGVRFSF